MSWQRRDLLVGLIAAAVMLATAVAMLYLVNEALKG
jgi:uncharacterized membrane protein